MITGSTAMVMEIESLRQQCAAQLAELEAISATLGTSEGHSSVAHILDLRQRNSDLVTGLEACDEQVVDLRQQLAAMEDKYLVERGMLRLKRAELADSQRDVRMLHSYLKRWAFTASDDECAHMEVQEALAATEPKTTS